MSIRNSLVFSRRLILLSSYVYAMSNQRGIGSLKGIEQTSTRFRVTGFFSLACGVRRSETDSELLCLPFRARGVFMLMLSRGDATAASCN